MKKSTALFKCRVITRSIKQEQQELAKQLFPDFSKLHKKRLKVRGYIAKYDLQTRPFKAVLFEADIHWISKQKVLLGHKLGV